MKLIIRLLIFVLLLVPFQNAAAERQNPNVVTLKAGQVDGANDIEEAILIATAEGTRPGMVILNGKDGPFVLTDADRSLNIFVSNLTLRGVNRAVIENCDDGLFFDGFPLQNILVEEIAFHCYGDGVEAPGSFQNVTLRNNLFQAGNNGIGTSGASKGWVISGNVIQAGGDGISMVGTAKAVITGNHLSGNVGINLQQCSLSDVRRNSIQAAYIGVYLGQEAWGNMVQKNTIIGVSSAGITLESSVTGNRIVANRVICAQGADCLTVDVSAETAELNVIAGNKP